MSFGDHPDDFKGGAYGFGEPAKFELPAKRTFVVLRKYEEPLMVEAHAFMVEESGALSFVEYVMLSTGGRELPIPQKHVAFQSWVQVYEQKERAVNALSH